MISSVVPRRRGARSTLLAVAIAGGAGACGPSFQAVYEGNARFEHCYALEENPQVAMPEKASCWRDWSERYTYGQTRDRIHYATARYVALSEARELPTDEAMMMAAPGEAPRLSTITAPTPTNAFAPPPKVLDDGGQLRSSNVYSGDPSNVPMSLLDAAPAAPGASAGAARRADPLPANACADGCASDFRSCTAACDAGPKCDGCNKTYKTCMRGCFK